MAKKKEIKPGMTVIAKTPLYKRRLTVLSDEGGGWYKCGSDEHGADLYHEKILTPEKVRTKPATKPPTPDGIDPKLLAQFKKWAKHLLSVNPSYVREPGSLRSYVKGPNWNEPHWEYAHYRDTVAGYGPELLAMFERMRAGDGDAGLSEYRSLLKAAGIEESK